MSAGPQYFDQGKTFHEADFGLDTRLIKALSKLGFVYPTLVQSKCIPLVLQGKDLLVRARTGSGKTAAYGLPLLQKILRRKEDEPGLGPGVRAVILVPTRELCEQVRSQMWALMHYCRDTVGILALADDNMSAQQAHLRDQPDVLVATPARLLAHLNAGNVSLKDTVDTLVVDEADLVLSFGYSDDIRDIVSRLPKICQGLLMSATLSPELEALKRVVLHSPAVLKLEEGQTVHGQLAQFFLTVRNKDDKYLVLFTFLKLGLLEGKGLFFVNSVDTCYRLKLFLELFHIRSAVLNAELPLNCRLHILQEFNRGIFDYLIATDESIDAEDGGESSEESGGEESGDENAEPTEGSSEKRKRPAPRGDSEYGVARGVDFRGVSFVVNFDFPPGVRSYTHRIGRTARGGASGTALSLVTASVPQDVNTLLRVQASQPALPPVDSFGNTIIGAMGPESEGYGGVALQMRPQPSPLAFDIREIEQFRYRVEDVRGKVTRLMVKEARLAELKQEMLNSDRLKEHFEENPDDLKVLRHDKTVVHPTKKLEHLKNIPSYLMPSGLQTGEDPTARQSKKRRRGGAKWQGGQGQDKQRRRDNDPLQSFEAGTLGAMEGGDGPRDLDLAQDGASGPPAKKVKKTPKPAAEDRVIQINSYTGKSTSGRRLWQEKHKKGKFGKKGLDRENRKKGTSFEPPKARRR